MTELSGSKPRKSPCASCPYRKNVPSGIWEAEEYDKLPEYDGDMAQQSPKAFGCHQGDGSICSGWLGYRDPQDLLAVRLGIMTGALDTSCAEYETSVPLFESGAAAAEHGKRDIADPSDEAIKMSQKVAKKRTL